MIESLCTLEQRVSLHLNQDLGYQLNKKDRLAMEKQVNCHICEESLSIPRKYENGKVIPIVKDHVSAFIAVKNLYFTNLEYIYI